MTTTNKLQKIIDLLYTDFELEDIEMAATETRTEINQIATVISDNLEIIEDRTGSLPTTDRVVVDVAISNILANLKLLK